MIRQLHSLIYDLLHVRLAKKEVYEHIMRIILASHFSLKKGIELFGKSVEKSTTNKLQEIHDMGMYAPQTASKLSKQDKHDAL